MPYRPELPCGRPGGLCPTVHSLWERGIPGLASLLLASSLNPKGVRAAVESSFIFGSTTRLGFFSVLKEIVLNPNLLINSVPCRAFALDYFKLGIGTGKGLVKLQGWFEFGICGGT